ncbi:MAG TPA: FtsL-like putative cell division protein [Chitinophaga sp.]|uniref:FtsL-like putative cell division protein n=1 Tax=Chitinophaga sp. TaxID=1869181 RepID=UPI002C3E8E07|nr:FtsL-like putative cell division protein [Chitinophaga sp.]HVI46543.1 FtsL-like putative cell division protein [Chitinophaga sp.]
MLQEEVIETNQETPADNTASREPKREWRLRINYRALVQNLPFIGFLSFLALIYIANSHLAEKKIRRINQLGKEIKELKWEYINVKSELMFRSKMSEVSKSVEPLGLKQLSSPPQKIILKQETEK